MKKRLRPLFCCLEFIGYPSRNACCAANGCQALQASCARLLKAFFQPVALSVNVLRSTAKKGAFLSAW
jgi:hypothetical protein